MRIALGATLGLLLPGAAFAVPTPLLSNNSFVVTLFGGVYNSAPPTLTNTQTSAFQLDAQGNLKVNVVTGGGGGGGGSTTQFGAAFATGGTAIGANYNGTMQSIGADGLNNLYVNLRTSIPFGTNTIGAVTQAGTWNVGITGVLPLPNGASNAALQGGVYSSSPPTLTNGQQIPLQVDANGNLKVNIVTGGGGGGGGGTSSTYGSAFPVTGTAIGAKNGTNMVNLTADGANNLNVDLQTALPTGSNTIGSVNQGGSWSVGISGSLPTGVNSIGSVAQSGTWTVGVGTSVLPTGAATAANQTAVIGTVAPGTASTNSLMAGGIYNATAPTATTGQQMALQTDVNGNLKVNVVAGGGGGGGGTSSSFGLAFPSAGTAIGAKNGGNMVGLSADALGNLQVNIQSFTGMATAANQTATIGSGTAGTAATSSMLAGGVYNATQPAPTTGQQTPIQLDVHGNIRSARGSLTIVPLDVATITSPNTAVTALSAGHATGGGWIQNPDSAAFDICINQVGTASGTTSSGSTTCIQPAQTYLITPSTGAVSVVSVDGAHNFSGYGYQ